MKLPPLTFRIAKLWGKAQGSVEKHQIEETIEYPEEKELQFEGPFKAELMLIRLKAEISALLTNATIKVRSTCQLCLENFTEEITIPSAEREFHYHPPERGQDAVDLFLIDTKAMTISLSEMVRQEIILHFPLIPVCSRGCKGLCPICGKNRNKAKCTCKTIENLETYQPFKDLKKIVKSAAPRPKKKK